MYFKDFVGKTCTVIRGMQENSDDLYMGFDDGSEIVMRHVPDCCEQVYVADVAGDPGDLLGVPMLMCEEADSVRLVMPRGRDSYTDTWYKFRTHNGDVTIRWRGESNGYYTEIPHVQCKPPKK